MKSSLLLIFCSSIFICGMFLGYLLSSCTLSLHNMNTHGKSSDVVDEELSTSPSFDPNLAFHT